MRKVGLAAGAALVLLAASLVSAQAASALGRSTPRPVPHGFLSGAMSPTRPAVPSTGLRAPARIAVAPVVCDGKFDVVASPNGTGDNVLYSVSAINANDVWAVGVFTNAAGYDRTLAEHWNGSTWSLVTSTVNPTSYSILNAVSATSANDVWAVGTYYDGAGFQPLIEHWNGSSWSPAASIQVSPSDNQFLAVSAFSSTDVWAVGEWTGTSGPRQSLAEHWDGSNWTVVATPNLGVGADNLIFGVAALEANHAVGVGLGNFVSGSSRRQGAAWDLLAGGGSTAQLESGPGTGDNALLAVARSGAGVWAVGYWRITATSARETLVIPATWDSASHTLTWGSPGLSDSPSAINNALYGVAAVTPSVFWATGYSSNPTVDRTLTELYCGVHFNLGAPATATTGVPFSLTVTAANADASTATRYVGTVHFTSTDPLAVLPADYTFTTGDLGSHTFSGVVLNTPYNQTITVKDTATPFVMGAVTISVHCLGACQSPAGTPGGRSAAPGPAGLSGGRSAAAGPGGVPGLRTAIRSLAGALEQPVTQRLAGIGAEATVLAPSASSVQGKTGLRVLASDATFVGTQERVQVLVSHRTAVTPGEADSSGNARVAISLGLLVFALLARRRRGIGEELSVHKET